MSQREHNKYLCTLKDLHIAIEKILQQITLKHTGESCSKCGGVCCKEEICRESIESAFLRFILGKEVVKKQSFIYELESDFGSCPDPVTYYFRIMCQNIHGRY